MKKLTLWMMAAVLSCSPIVFTSCSSNDNIVTPPKEEKNADRAVFEKILSERLTQTAADTRFEAAMESTKALTDFLNALDEKALKDQISTFLTKVVQGGKTVQMSSLSAQDKAAVEKCMKDRFNMTADELESTTFFIQLNAYKTLNKLHLTFENGVCTSSEDAEGFTVEVGRLQRSPSSRSSSAETRKRVPASSQHVWAASFPLPFACRSLSM